MIDFGKFELTMTRATILCQNRAFYIEYTIIAKLHLNEIIGHIQILKKLAYKEIITNIT
jgi:hypothetical protein